MKLSGCKDLLRHCPPALAYLLKVRAGLAALLVQSLCEQRRPGARSLVVRARSRGSHAHPCCRLAAEVPGAEPPGLRQGASGGEEASLSGPASAAAAATCLSLANAAWCRQRLRAVSGGSGACTGPWDVEAGSM